MWLSSSGTDASQAPNGPNFGCLGLADPELAPRPRTQSGYCFGVSLTSYRDLGQAHWMARGSAFVQSGYNRVERDCRMNRRAPGVGGRCSPRSYRR